MFGQDYRTSIGYMRNFGVVNNPHVAAKLRGFLLFHPKRAGLPALKMGTVQDISGYDTVVQTHRVWTPEEGILWNKGDSVFYQVGLVGVDGAGRSRFSHHTGLPAGYALADQILALGLYGCACCLSTVCPPRQHTAAASPRPLVTAQIFVLIFVSVLTSVVSVCYSML